MCVFVTSCERADLLACVCVSHVCARECAAAQTVSEWRVISQCPPFFLERELRWTPSLNLKQGLVCQLSNYRWQHAGCGLVLFTHNRIPDNNSLERAKLLLRRTVACIQGTISFPWSLFADDVKHIIVKN
jgi:hypothetical protein